MSSVKTDLSLAEINDVWTDPDDNLWKITSIVGELVIIAPMPPIKDRNPRNVSVRAKGWSLVDRPTL